MSICVHLAKRNALRIEIILLPEWKLVLLGLQPYPMNGVTVNFKIVITDEEIVCV